MWEKPRKNRADSIFFLKKLPMINNSHADKFSLSLRERIGKTYTLSHLVIPQKERYCKVKVYELEMLNIENYFSEIKIRTVFCLFFACLKISNVF